MHVPFWKKGVKSHHGLNFIVTNLKNFIHNWTRSQYYAINFSNLNQWRQQQNLVTSCKDDQDLLKKTKIYVQEEVHFNQQQNDELSCCQNRLKTNQNEICACLFLWMSLNCCWCNTRYRSKKNSSLSCPGARVWTHREFAKVTRTTWVYLQLQ